MDSWREEVDPSIRQHLESLISEAVLHRDAYGQAKNTANAQLWCVLGILQKQIVDQNLKIKFLEKALQGMSPKKKGKKPGEDPAKELSRVLKRL